MRGTGFPMTKPLMRPHSIRVPTRGSRRSLSVGGTMHSMRSRQACVAASCSRPWSRCCARRGGAVQSDAAHPAGGRLSARRRHRADRLTMAGSRWQPVQGHSAGGTCAGSNGHRRPSRRPSATSTASCRAARTPRAVRGQSAPLRQDARRLYARTFPVDELREVTSLVPRCDRAEIPRKGPGEHRAGAHGDRAAVQASIGNGSRITRRRCASSAPALMPTHCPIGRRCAPPSTPCTGEADGRHRSAAAGGRGAQAVLTRSVVMSGSKRGRPRPRCRHCARRPARPRDQPSSPAARTGRPSPTSSD